MTVQTSLLRQLGDLLIWLAVIILPYLLILLLLVALVRWLAANLARPHA